MMYRITIIMENIFDDIDILIKNNFTTEQLLASI